mgnify:CR=1 FL=1
MIEVKEYDIPIYRGIFVVIITNNVDELREYIPEFDGELYAHSWLHAYNDKQGFLCVLNFEARRAVTHGTIAHEATHIAHMILEQRGVLPDFINDEPVAYLVELLTDTIYKACKKYKIVRNGKRIN